MIQVYGLIVKTVGPGSTVTFEMQILRRRLTSAKQPLISSGWYQSDGETSVAMMQAADSRDGDHSSDPGLDLHG